MLQLLFGLAIVLFASSSVHADQEYYVHRTPSDSSTNAYALFLPEGSVKGLIVRDYSQLPKRGSKPTHQFHHMALDAGIAMLYTLTSAEFPELYIREQPMMMLDDILYDVLTTYNLPKDNIVIGGISASGTRALRFAEYCAMGKSNHGIRIAGVFAVDSPLDLKRFFRSTLQHKQHFKAGMLDEADLMQPLWEKNFIVDNAVNHRLMADVSVFDADDPQGGNASTLASTPLMLWHEPDLDWWMNERGCSYLDINSIDIAAFVVTIRSLGNNSVELVTTSGKGYDAEGRRNCHSWTIVDEQRLIRWIISCFK